MEKKKLLFILVALLGFLLPLPLYAYDNEASAWVDKNQCQMKPYLEEAKQLKEEMEKEVFKLIQAKKLEGEPGCQRIETEQENQERKAKDKPSTFIFVSLSMPKESLKNLYKEAEAQGLPLIIRGLKNNSFVNTAQALRELEIAVQIDPQLFEEYQIKAVPTFIRLDEKQPLSLQGNVSLQYAQKKFEEDL